MEFNNVKKFLKSSLKLLQATSQSLSKCIEPLGSNVGPMANNNQ